jgi:cytochrome c biogenesis protein ResB
LSALGAALYSIGIPHDSSIQYETALKSDKFLVIAHGTSGQVEQARSILETAGATQLDIHTQIRDEYVG